MGRGAVGSDSARRVLRVLFSFDRERHTQTVREIAERTALPIASAHRYVALLRDESLLVDTGGGRYRLSGRALSPARALEAADTLLGRADATMRRLAAETGETVLLVELAGERTVCTHRVESPRRLRLSFEPGYSMPARGGASAKVLLAALGGDARREALRHLSEEERAALSRELDRVAGEGWATSLEEVDDGIWAASALVDDYSGHAALTVAAPLSRATESLRQEIVAATRAAAAELSVAPRA